MTEISTNIKAQKLIGNLTNRYKMWLYFLFKLPSAWFWGIRIHSLTPDQCSVTLPYSWKSKNPFRSIYFASQTGAAELSTGLLGIIAIEGQVPISMLVTRVDASFVRKADSITTFHCNEGDKIQNTVVEAIKTNKGQSVTVSSTGMDQDGNVVSRFHFTWSFKTKSH